MNKNYLFVLGDNPYENSHGDYHTKGNGEWFTTAAELEEALKVIFNSMDFPGEATGRKTFVPGISLEGVPSEEVIQVWSDAPGIFKRTKEALGIKSEKASGLHDGRGRDLGLHAEVHVKEIEKYNISYAALLKAPDESGDPGTGVSPLAASVMRYQETRHEISKAMQLQKMDVARKQWEVERIEEEMEEKMRAMQEQIAVFDAYLHGTRHRTCIKRGAHGTGRYKVFQNRVFLSDEIAILGNFEDMDFKGMADLEKWLIESGHVWKMLPFERCILATRIRKENKDYGDPLANFWNNQANMQNMIWIRDGENVFHVDVEISFNNAVFPYRDQFERTKMMVLDHVWSKAFRWSVPKNWHGEKLKPGEYEVPGTMKRKPLEEEEPYETVRIEKARFKTLQDWIDDPTAYTPILEKQMMEAVDDYLRAVNKKHMLFAVIIQGIVDNTNYLEIPKGTDMFNWENVDRYMDLVQDYSHGLSYPVWQEKLRPYVDGKVTLGDWIVANVEEHIKGVRDYDEGTTYHESFPMLFKVIGLEDATIRRWVTDKDDEEGEWKNIACKRPVVKYFPVSSRRHRDDDWGVRRRVKQPINLLLRTSNFVRVPMSPQIAKDILNDREWKKKNTWLVPYMVNYGKIIEAMKSPVNGAQVKWKHGND